MDTYNVVVLGGYLSCNKFLPILIKFLQQFQILVLVKREIVLFF